MGTSTGSVQSVEETVGWCRKQDVAHEGSCLQRQPTQELLQAQVAQPDRPGKAEMRGLRSKELSKSWEILRNGPHPECTFGT